MLQSPKPIRRSTRQAAEEQGFLDPASITTRFYALKLAGDCMEPVFKDGEAVVFDREAPLENGCFANFFYRPELVKPGRLGVALKKLVFAPPPWVTFPWREHPNSDAISVMLVEQFNPRQQWSIRCDMLLAVHRCIGRKDSPEVDEYLAREWRP
jgi:hypothetical protein